MNKAPLFTLLMLAGCAGLVHAQTAQELQFTELSSFDAPAKLRNPFWPVGWQETAVSQESQAENASSVAAPVVREIELSPRDFVVSSISTGNMPLALINGKAYGEGDLIPYNAGGQKITVQVFAIRDGAVTLRYRNKSVVATIKGTKLSH